MLASVEWHILWTRIFHPDHAFVRALWTTLSIAVVAQFCMVGPFWALSSMVEPRHSAAVIALINSLGNLGGLAGSYTIGALRNSAAGFRNGMVCVGLSLGVAGCLVLLVGKKERRFAKAM